MAFSPETYALIMCKIDELKRLIDSADSEISDIDTTLDEISTALASTWKIGTTEASSLVVTALETAFTNASTGEMYSGSYGASSYQWCWYGIKYKADKVSKCFFIVERNTGGASIGIAERSVEGTWTFYTIEQGDS